MSNRLSNNEFLSRLKNINEWVEPQEAYIGYNTHITCKCLRCGNVWMVKPGNLFSGKGCPKCAQREAGNRYRKPLSKFIKDLHSVFPHIDIVGEYKNAHTKTSFRCNSCGNTWDAKPTNILSGYGCPSCWSNRRFGMTMKKHDDFIKEVSLIHPTISIMSKYTGVTEPILCVCQECGCEWKTTPDYLLHRSGCPNCTSSYGEQRVASYLLKHNIRFDKWKRYEGLVGVGGGKLSYDFYIPSINILIEYQGQYHDGTVSLQTQNDFERQKEHDRRKRKFAKDNHIRLLEIWYRDYKNIERILDAEIAS